MSIKFAEQILDSMVDENGYCGERGLSYKQFNCLSRYLEEGEWEHVGGWVGTKGGRKNFYSCDFEGNIGKYHVILNLYAHFNDRYTVKEIRLRDADEYQAELDAKAKLKALRDFSGSEWVAEPKKRIDLTLTLVNDYVYDGESYSYYDSGVRHIYTLRDENGNCFVWKTSNHIELWDEAKNEYIEAEIGSAIQMRATVKEYNEYKGIKQTVINRPKITGIC